MQRRPSPRNRVFGAVGVLWGGGILASRLFQFGGYSRPAASDAYAAGQTGGLIFGGLLLVVGLYYLVKG